MDDDKTDNQIYEIANIPLNLQDPHYVDDDIIPRDINRVASLIRRLVMSDVFKTSLAYHISGIESVTANVDLDDFVHALRGALLKIFKDHGVFVRSAQIRGMNDLHFPKIVHSEKIGRGEIRTAIVDICSNHRGRVPRAIEKQMCHILDAISTSLDLSVLMSEELHVAPKIELLAKSGKSLCLDYEEMLIISDVCKQMDDSVFADIILRLASFRISNLYGYQKKRTARFEERFKKELIRFIAYEIVRGSDISSYTKVNSFLSIIEEIFSIEGIEIYISELNNDMILFGRIWQCVKEGRADLSIITCPDYSGEVVEDNNVAVWKYNFNSLGSGEGTVARKSYAFVIGVYNVFKRHLGDVNVYHYLPAFEFKPETGFKSSGDLRNDLSYDSCLSRMSDSLTKIHGAYGIRNIVANTGLSLDFVSHDDFESAKQGAFIEIQSAIERGDSLILEILDAVYKHRKNLYIQWYPKTVMEEESIYQARIKKDIIPHQLAEFVVFGRILTQSSTGILLASDSPLMSEIFTYIKSPVLFGKGSGEVDYVGA